MQFRLSLSLRAQWKAWAFVCVIGVLCLRGATQCSLLLICILTFKKRQYNPFFCFPSFPHSRSTVVPMEQVQHLQTILQQVPLLCQLSQIQWTIPPLTDMEILFTQPQVFFSFSPFLFCIFAVKRLWHGNGYHSPPRFLNRPRWLDLQPSMRRNQPKLHIKPAWFHSILKLVPVWPRETLSILTFKADQCEKISFSKEVKLWALSPNELESEKLDGNKETVLTNQI